MNERDRTDIWERTDTPRETGGYATPRDTGTYETHGGEPHRYGRASDQDVRGKSPDQLEEEIERIRQEMNETLSAIEHRLSPGQMIDRALHSLKGGPAEFASNLGSSLRDNPLPATLIGIGLGWLMMDERRPPRRSASHPMTGDTIGSVKGKMMDGMEAVRGKMGESRGKGSETGGRMKDKFAEMKHSVSEKVHHATDRMHHTRETTGERMHSMGDRARHLREGMSERGHRTGERVHEMRSSVTDFAHEQPIMLGLIGLGIGAVVAAMLPPTRTEDEWLGHTSDRMKEEAMQTGRTQMDRARHVASAAAETAREEADRQLH